LPPQRLQTLRRFAFVGSVDYCRSTSAGTTPLPPVPYAPGFSFTGYQTANPADPLPGPMVDNELFDLQETTDSLIAALAQIQRSDGALQNGIVTTESLAVELIGGLKPPTAWVTAHAYAISATVFNGPKLYICAIAHTSGTFATDLAAGKWVQLADFTPTGVTPASSVSFIPGSTGLVATDIQASTVELKTYIDALTVSKANASALGALAALNIVDTAHIADAAVTLAKLADAAALSVTGRDSNTTGARGDIVAAADGYVLRRNGTTLGFGQVATAGIADAAVTPVKQSSAGGIGGAYSKLAVKVTSNTALTVTADYLSVFDASGNMKVLTNVNVTIDLASGGLDTGTEAASTFYFVHVFFNGSTVTGRVSASATAPTYPSGYTFRARVGAVRNDGSSNLWRSVQYNRRAQLVIGTNPVSTPIMVSGATGTWSVVSPVLASVSVAAFVPATAASIRLTVGNTYGSTANNAAVVVAPNTAWGGVGRGPQGSINVWPIYFDDGGQGGSNGGGSVDLLLEALTIGVAIGSGNEAAVACIGWEDNL
jgi:hypothetical protein